MLSAALGWTLLLAACGGSLGRGARGSLLPEPTPSPEQLVEQLQAELIPAVNCPTGYGPLFNQYGFTELLQWNKAIRPADSWPASYEALDIAILCCGATHPHRDESQNCSSGRDCLRKAVANGTADSARGALLE